MHDPFLFSVMEKAVLRILLAIEKNQTITVYGDYDVDVVTSTAMLVRFLNRIGAKCNYYLPNRLTEGYGISKDGIQDLIENGTNLIISVDCGISAYDEIALASSHEIDVIVTDHHEVKESLPLAFAIIYSQMGEHQANIERAARDLGAAEWQVLALITLPLLWPALMASFFLSFTLSWDEFIIALLVSRFDVTLPVEIWSLLRSGLNPKTNAVGSLVFIVSIVFVFVTEIVLFGRSKSR